MRAICFALAALLLWVTIHAIAHPVAPYSSPPDTATTTVQPDAHATINTQNGGTP